MSHFKHEISVGLCAAAGLGFGPWIWIFVRHTRREFLFPDHLAGVLQHSRCREFAVGLGFGALATAKHEYMNRSSELRDIVLSGAECATDPMETLAAYLKLVEECRDAFQRTSARNFNNEQCEYLADKLQVVVGRARSFLEVPCANCHGPGSSEDMARYIEIYKLLLALAKEIERFNQGCCRDGWIQAAMTLTNVSEYVSSMGFNLELCRLALNCKDCAASGSLTMDQVADVHKNEVEVVEKKASADLNALFEKVLVKLNSLNKETRDLATYLLQRLKRVKQVAASGSPSRGMNDGGFFGNLFEWVKPMKKLAKGSSCTVYEAMWLGTRVAKKTFQGRHNEFFKREVEILAGLCHPNITSMFCCVQHQQSCSILMELMDEDLHDLMERRCEQRYDGKSHSPPFSNLEAVDLMLQVAEGVNYLHNRVSPSIVHRDLKSSNILVKCVTGRGSEGVYVHAKVTDFGLSKTKDSSIRHSQQSWNTGTNKWMAPEIINLDAGTERCTSCNEGVFSYPLKCDVYSFAIVCYEILTGHEPFPDESATVVKRKVMKGERPLLPGYCPNRLKALIMECWNQDPRKRPSFEVICLKLKYIKYLFMSGSINSNQDPHLTIEEPSQMAACDTHLLPLVPVVPENMGRRKFGGWGGAALRALDILRNIPQFQALISMVQANPQIMQFEGGKEVKLSNPEILLPTLQALRKQNPAFVRYIENNQAAFLWVIIEASAEGVEVGDATVQPAGTPQSANVTPEKESFIKWLVGGLPRVPRVAGGRAVSGALHFLRSNFQFQLLRSMLQADPAVLQLLVRELAKQNPNLLTLIDINRVEAMSLIMERCPDRNRLSRSIN